MLNQSILVGRIVKEPEIRETENGNKVTNITLAVKRSFKNIEGEALGAILSDKEIYVGTGSACTTGDFEPSHVLKAMNVPDEYINGTLRISTGWYNTEEEVVIAANEIANAYNYLSKE